jgi:hypothetical protein
MQATSYLNGITESQSRSAEFDSASIATVRRPRAMVHVVWTDPFIDTSLTVSANDENRATVTDHAADTKTVPPYKYALLDGSFKLDGSYHPFPITVQEKLDNQVGWYGNKISGAGGWFSAPYPELTVEFDPRPVFGIYVVGDHKTNQYPVDFQIRIMNGTSLLSSLNVTDNDAVEFVYDIDAGTATKIILAIQKWSTVGTCCKIVEFYTTVQKTYSGDDILSMNLLEEREIRDGSLPVGNISSNELDIEFQNIKLESDGSVIIDPFFPGNTASYLSNLVKPNRKITPYVGFRLPNGDEEFIRLGTFWTGDWNIDDKSAGASVSCRDRMELLRKVKFTICPLYEDITLYDLADAILNIAKTYIPMNDLAWDIDDELDDYTVPFAWFAGMNYMEVLREIAEACLGQAYMNADDVLIIEGPSKNIPEYGADPDIEITKDHYFNKKQPMKSDELINTVFVETQPLAVGSSETIYTSEEVISIGPNETLDPITIKYSDVPVKDGAAGFTEETGSVSLVFDAEDYYCDGAVLTVRNTTANSGTFKITLSGSKLEVEGSEKISSSDESSIVSNGTLEYDYPKNSLIQTREVAQLVADTLVNSYSIERKDIELSWMGNPALELGDIFRAPEYQRGSIDNRGDFMGFRNKLDFDGTLRGTLSGRKVTKTVPETLVVQDSDEATDELQDSDEATTIYQDGD